MTMLRSAYPTDAGATGGILYRFQQDTQWMPKLYSEVETIAFCGEMIDRGWVTVAEEDGRILGFLARDGEEICAFYLSGDDKRQGIGKLLLDHAKADCPRLRLRVFQANTGAQRFYRREGFAELTRGDGSDNEEQLPEVTFVWEPEPTTAKGRVSKPAPLPKPAQKEPQP